MARKYNRNGSPLVPLLVLGGAGAALVYMFTRKDAAKTVGGETGGAKSLTTPTSSSTDPKLAAAVEAGKGAAQLLGTDAFRSLDMSEETFRSALNKDLAVRVVFNNGEIGDATAMLSDPRSTMPSSVATSFVQSMGNLIAQDRTQVPARYKDADIFAYKGKFNVGIVLQLSDSTGFTVAVDP